MKRIALLAGIGVLVGGAGCGDTCGDVACAPAPPMLQVAVLDTVLDTVRVVAPEGDTTGADSVDTVMVVQGRITDALVTLLRVDAADTVAFDTLESAGDTFYRNDAEGLPATPFVVRAERGARVVQQGDLKLRSVEGCCPYSVVGFYSLRLPAQ